MKKVVLAYSGGLDTSCIIPWLKDKGYQTIAFIADVGQGDDFDKIKKRALESGASKVYCKNVQKELVEDYVFPALKARALYEEKYCLACALSRPLIAKYQVEIAKKEKAQALVHGCTGKGNDQVRFETTFRLVGGSKFEVIAPVRFWEFKTRNQEIDYLESQGIKLSVTKKSPYSIDTNIYGRAIECGVLEDPWNEPPEDIYAMTKDPRTAPDRPTYVEITFDKGTPTKINGTTYAPLGIITKLNDIAGRNGVGRVDMIENRLVGIKSREIYENPAATVLHMAIESLECLVLDRETMKFKTQLSQKYAELTYNGLWFTPLREQLDAYFTKAHKFTTGVVRLKLYKGSCQVVGRKSKHSRYRLEKATYGDEDTFDQSLADGFNQLWAMPFEK